MPPVIVACAIAVALAVVPFPAPAWSWTQLGLDIDGESAADLSGNAVALSKDGTRVAIGAPDNNNDKGHVRVFDLVATGIPTLPEWGPILLTLSLVAIATWQ